MVPLYLSFARQKPFLGRNLWEIQGVFALLCATAVVVFWQTRVHLFSLFCCLAF